MIYRLRSFLLYGVVFAFPWFFLPFTQEYFITHKFYLVATAMLVSLALLAVSLVVSKKIHLVKTSFDRIFVLLIAAQCISLLFSSPNKAQALTALPWGLAPVTMLVIFYFLLTNTLTHRDDLTRLIKTLMAGAMVAGLVSVIFWFNPLKNTQLPLGLDFLKNARFSVIGNALDTLALMGFLCMAGVMSMISGFTENKKISALAVGGLVTGIAALTLVGYATFFPPKDQVGMQLPPLQTSWYATLDTLKSTQTAVVGVGLDNYSSAFTAAKPRAYNSSSTWGINFNLGRAMILHVWTETGLLGLASFLLLWIYIVREIQGLFAEKDKSRGFYAAWAAYAGILTIITPPSSILFFLIILLCAALALKAHHYNPAEVNVELKSLPLLCIGLAVVLVAVVVGMGYLGGRAYASEFYFKKSLDSIRKNDGKEMYNNLIKAIRANPYLERNHIQFSQINLLLANNVAQKKDLKDSDRQDIARLVQLAISEAKTTVQLNPQKVEYWNNLAFIYRNIINVAQGAESWTVASYRRAIAQDPNNPVIRLNLGGVYYSLKDYPQAVQLF